MKRITMTKSDFMKIAVPVIAIVSLVLIMTTATGCGTGHVSCDAYGQNDIDNGSISEDEGS